TKSEARNFSRSVKTGARRRSKKSKKKKLLLFIKIINRVINKKQNLNRMGFLGNTSIGCFWSVVSIIYYWFLKYNEYCLRKFCESYFLNVFNECKRLLRVCDQIQYMRCFSGGLVRDSFEACSGKLRRWQAVCPQRTRGWKGEAGGIEGV